MIKLSSENSDMLKDILREEKNAPMINDLITEILGLKINSVKFEDMKKFDTISEYEFSMVKTNCDLEMEDTVDIYFKIIKKDRIKESVFCYWCLLYEEALERNEEQENMATIINKVMISEVGMERYKNSVLLEMEGNDTDILKYGTEVHFIDFVKYVKKHENKKNNIGDWLGYIDNESEDILMVGIVLNKDIGRSNIQIV